MGALGLWGFSQNEVERTEICSAERNEAVSALATNNFQSARSALESAKVNCAGSKEAEIATALADVAVKETAFQRARGRTSLRHSKRKPQQPARRQPWTGSLPFRSK